VIGRDDELGPDDGDELLDGLGPDDDAGGDERLADLDLNGCNDWTVEP
jgi:hypothetical protein